MHPVAGLKSHKKSQQENGVFINDENPHLSEPYMTNSSMEKYPIDDFAEYNASRCISTKQNTHEDVSNRCNSSMTNLYTYSSSIEHNQDVNAAILKFPMSEDYFMNSPNKKPEVEYSHIQTTPSENNNTNIMSVSLLPCGFLKLKSKINSQQTIASKIPVFHKSTLLKNDKEYSKSFEHCGVFECIKCFDVLQSKKNKSNSPSTKSFENALYMYDCNTPAPEEIPNYDGYKKLSNFSLPADIHIKPTPKLKNNMEDNWYFQKDAIPKHLFKFKKSCDDNEYRNYYTSLTTTESISSKQFWNDIVINSMHFSSRESTPIDGHNSKESFTNNKDRSNSLNHTDSNYINRYNIQDSWKHQADIKPLLNCRESSSRNHYSRKDMYMNNENNVTRTSRRSPISWNRYGNESLHLKDNRKSRNRNNRRISNSTNSSQENEDNLNNRISRTPYEESKYWIRYNREDSSRNYDNRKSRKLKDNNHYGNYQEIHKMYTNNKSRKKTKNINSRNHYDGQEYVENVNNVNYNINNNNSHCNYNYKEQDSKKYNNNRNVNSYQKDSNFNNCYGIRETGERNEKNKSRKRRKNSTTHYDSEESLENYKNITTIKRTKKCEDLNSMNCYDHKFVKKQNETKSKKLRVYTKSRNYYEAQETENNNNGNLENKNHGYYRIHKSKQTEVHEIRLSNNGISTDRCSQFVTRKYDEFVKIGNELVPNMFISVGTKKSNNDIEECAPICRKWTKYFKMDDTDRLFLYLRYKIIIVYY